MEGFSWEVVATVVTHDAHPVLEWCIGNVVGRYDARANVYPRKARPEQKIDAAVALIMGIARCMMMQPGAFGLREPRGDLRLMTAESTGHAGCDCAFSVIDGPVRSAAHDWSACGRFRRRGVRARDVLTRMVKQASGCLPRNPT